MNALMVNDNMYHYIVLLYYNKSLIFNLMSITHYTYYYKHYAEIGGRWRLSLWTVHLECMCVCAVCRWDHTGARVVAQVTKGWGVSERWRAVGWRAGIAAGRNWCSKASRKREASKAVWLIVVSVYTSLWRVD